MSQERMDCKPLLRMQYRRQNKVQRKPQNFPLKIMSLKTLITANGSVDFVIDYIGPEQDFPKKAGGTYKACKLIVKTRSNGETYEDKMFLNETKLYKVGDLINASLNDKGYVQWRKVESGEPRNNYSEIKKERAMSNQVDADKIKSVAISLQGLVQAHVSAGKTNEQALMLAVEARQMILQKAVELA